ncbi:DUF397 domain-containing protein [Saccharopolyspora sp. SCSIO 74807]|uniref:DUF397 domain-containing protein n=1 Tax=Saccharopolyspora sp. SCSIO 74807 TaxID=3118084 RepID=UPI0030D09CB0
MTPDFSNAIWRKSSRSGSSGGACVEVAFVSADAAWRKSSRSQGNGGACVEVAVEPSVVGIRDSKSPDGPVLAFDRGTFTTFLDSLKSRVLQE